MSLLETIQEHASETEGAAQAAAEHSSGMAIGEVPAFIEHHIADGGLIEYMGWHWDVSTIHLPVIQLGPVANVL